MDKMIVRLSRCKKGFVNKAISFFTKSEFTHAEILYKGIVYGYTMSGYYQDKVGECRKFNGKKVEFNINSIESAKLEYLLRIMSNKEYDMLGALASAFNDTKRAKGFYKDTHLGSGDFFCSEYVALMMKELFPAKYRGIIPEEITPGDLSRIV